MADFGEYTPMYAQTGFDGRWWNEEYNEILHGYMPQDWASLNRYVLAINKAKFIKEIKAKNVAAKKFLIFQPIKKQPHNLDLQSCVVIG